MRVRTGCLLRRQADLSGNDRQDLAAVRKEQQESRNGEAAEEDEEKFARRGDVVVKTRPRRRTVLDPSGEAQAELPPGNFIAKP